MIMIILGAILAIISILIWLDLSNGGWIHTAQDPFTALILLGFQIGLGLILPILSVTFLVIGFFS